MMSITRERAPSITGLGIVCSVGHDVGELTAALRRSACGVDFRQRLAPSVEGVLRIGAEIRGFSFEGAVERVAGRDAGLRARALRIGRRAPLALQTAIAAALEAWVGAGLNDADVAPERVSILIAGSNLAQEYVFKAHAEYGQDPTFISPRFALEFLDTNHLGAISELLNATGDGCSVGGASASGAVALVRASQLLRLGSCDICVVVAPMLELSILELHALANSGALCRKFADAPAAACRPFDQQHCGFVYGEASGCMVLERGELSERRTYGYLRGGSVRLDATASTKPSARGEARAMRSALEDACLDVRDIDYVNAHGTSSPLGDKTEVEAFKNALGAHVAQVDINSTKGLLGHCLTSAGLVEAIATTLQMQHGFVHANLNLNDPIDDECGFVRGAAKERRMRYAISNSFGFGGINASVVIGSART